MRWTIAFGGILVTLGLTWGASGADGLPGGGWVDSNWGAPGDDQTAADPLLQPAGGQTGWLAMGDALAMGSGDANRTGANMAGPRKAAATQPTSRPTPWAGDANLPYVPWRQRHGPAYPDQFWPSLGRYGKEMPATLWDDTVATFQNPISLIAFGGVAAAGISLHDSGADKEIRNDTAYHESMKPSWEHAFDAVGNPGTAFAVGGAMLVGSLAYNDATNYEKSCAMMNALVINGVTTVALEGLTHRESPNGDRWAWPSGHTSSMFTFATVAEEEYGPIAGVPLYGLATMVGIERISSRQHNLSDVISGAILGFAIAHGVCHNHQPRVLGFDVVPYVDPANGTVGVAATKKF